jgi:hypothetical protein
MTYFSSLELKDDLNVRLRLVRWRWLLEIYDPDHIDTSLLSDHSRGSVHIRLHCVPQYREQHISESVIALSVECSVGWAG